MTLLNVRPANARRINHGFNSVLDELLKDTKTSTAKKTDFVPRANILEHKQEFEIQLELPGFNKNQVNLNIDKDVLTISGSRNDTEEAQKANIHVQQIKTGSFERSFYLPEDIDTDKISAKLENGILFIEIPKDEKKLLKKSVNID